MRNLKGDFMTKRDRSVNGLNLNGLNLKRALIAPSLVLLAALSACSVYVTPDTVAVRGNAGYGIELGDVITAFSPGRGEGATYYVGETISFRVRSREPGYLTLTAIDPDGAVYVFARNIPVIRGTNRISGPSPRTTFSLTPPRGVQRVRASFTSNPTDTTRVLYRGEVGEDVWVRSIVTDVQSFPVRERDIARTSFVLR